MILAFSSSLVPNSLLMARKAAVEIIQRGVLLRIAKHALAHFFVDRVRVAEQGNRAREEVVLTMQPGVLQGIANDRAVSPDRKK